MSHRQKIITFSIFQQSYRLIKYFRFYALVEFNIDKLLEYLVLGKTAVDFSDWIVSVCFIYKINTQKRLMIVSIN